MARHGDHQWDGARGYDHVFALIFLAVAGHHPVLFQLRGPCDQLNAVLFHQELDTAHQFAGDLALSLLDLLEAEAARVPEDLLADQFPDLFHGDCLVHQVFGGNAPHVQAGAAHVFFFEHRRFQAVFGGIDGQGIAAGTTADHQYIKL